MIPLSPPFLEYLRSDGIILPSEDQTVRNDDDSGTFSYPTSPTASETEDEEPDPSLAWLDIHQKIKSAIAELDGSIVPKLNWSAPRDATWISATNSMECRTPNDIYLLLKSSDFITHDLECAFDDCTNYEDGNTPISDRVTQSSRPQTISQPSEFPNIPYNLVLRKTIPSVTTSLEFRCFVRARHLLCICQRDLNHYPFLATLRHFLRELIQEFFDINLQKSFPGDSFVFDVYIPPPHARVWLIDINPWVSKTDPLLFSWLEILEKRGGDQGETAVDHEQMASDNESEEDDLEEEYKFEPEFRLVNRDDPEAYNFSTPQFSAHKLPKDVVDASADGESGLRGFMAQWRDIISGQERDDAVDIE